MPAASGTLGTHTAPPRSTNPFAVWSMPLASVYCNATAAVSSSVQACTVKLSPLTWLPFCGQSRVSDGGVLSPLVSNM